MNTRIAIADDNNFLIKSVKDKLSFHSDISIAFTANDGHQCLEKLKLDTRIKLILMDIEMPRLNGIEATVQIKQKYPQIKIIMLTVFDDDENIFKAIQSGADGYLLKETSSPELYNAIFQTLEGGAAMTPSIALKTLNLLRSPMLIKNTESEESVKLTGRELEVLEQLAVGLPYTAIAENLIISPSTVRRHIENIYKKLQVHSKVQAIELAKRKRII
ncbi:response regulator transcription factor [uncultured Draconibacterium sp.]|uniref:response regulator transcription factor n=1 Tax=uncultured Draconibacterium sp. TaxID=1573823 RepID=UPI0029C7BDC8|nr:response regulator transcription factor [uncultured Draconibacterium sp.]